MTPDVVSIGHGRPEAGHKPGTYETTIDAVVFNPQDIRKVTFLFADEKTRCT